MGKTAFEKLMDGIDNRASVNLKGFAQGAVLEEHAAEVLAIQRNLAMLVRPVLAMAPTVAEETFRPTPPPSPVSAAAPATAPRRKRAARKAAEEVKASEETKA